MELHTFFKYPILKKSLFGFFLKSCNKAQNLYYVLPKTFLLMAHISQRSIPCHNEWKLNVPNHMYAVIDSDGTEYSWLCVTILCPGNLLCKLLFCGCELLWQKQLQRKMGLLQLTVWKPSPLWCENHGSRSERQLQWDIASTEVEVETDSELSPFNPLLRNDADHFQSGSSVSLIKIALIGMWLVPYVSLQPVKLITSIGSSHLLNQGVNFPGIQGSCFGLLSLLFIFHMVFCVKQYTAFKKSSFV